MPEETTDGPQLRTATLTNEDGITFYKGVWDLESLRAVVRNYYTERFPRQCSRQQLREVNATAEIFRRQTAQNKGIEFSKKEARQAVLDGYAFAAYRYLEQYFAQLTKYAVERVMQLANMKGEQIVLKEFGVRHAVLKSQLSKDLAYFNSIEDKLFRIGVGRRKGSKTRKSRKTDEMVAGVMEERLRQLVAAARELYGGERSMAKETLKALAEQMKKSPKTVARWLKEGGWELETIIQRSTWRVTRN